MNIVTFSIWLNIPYKYIEDLYVIVSVIVSYIFRAWWHDFVLSLQALGLVQTKSNMSSHSVRFSSAGVLNLSNNKDKASYFDWKINKIRKCKLPKLMTQISS